MRQRPGNGRTEVRVQPQQKKTQDQAEDVRDEPKSPTDHDKTAVQNINIFYFAHL